MYIYTCTNTCRHTLPTHIHIGIDDIGIGIDMDIHLRESFLSRKDSECKYPVAGIPLRSSTETVWLEPGEQRRDR